MELRLARMSQSKWTNPVPICFLRVPERAKSVVAARSSPNTIAGLMMRDRALARSHAPVPPGGASDALDRFGFRQA